jgi:hypothetical protein
LHACSCTVARIRESINGPIVHHLVVASTVQVLL